MANRSNMNVGHDWQIILDSSKSTPGSRIAELYVEKIRGCDDWQELYDEMHPSSRFYKDMHNYLVGELKCRV